VGYPKIGGEGVKGAPDAAQRGRNKKKREKSREEGNKKIKVKWY